jgi:hypothetical protein
MKINIIESIGFISHIDILFDFVVEVYFVKSVIDIMDGVFEDFPFLLLEEVDSWVRQLLLAFWWDDIAPLYFS